MFPNLPGGGAGLPPLPGWEQYFHVRLAACGGDDDGDDDDDDGDGDEAAARPSYVSPRITTHFLN